MLVFLLRNAAVLLLMGSAVKFTSKGSITIECRTHQDPQGLQKLVEVNVSDTGCGIPAEKLEALFRVIEGLSPNLSCGLGLGLATVVRSIDQIGGQLRAESVVGIGSRFSFLLPLSTGQGTTEYASQKGAEKEFIEALSSGMISAFPSSQVNSSGEKGVMDEKSKQSSMNSSNQEKEPHLSLSGEQFGNKLLTTGSDPTVKTALTSRKTGGSVCAPPKLDLSVRTERLRVLVVEDEKVNRNILCRRLKLAGHDVVESTNGQEAVDVIKSDRRFDVILMDIQYVLDHFSSAELTLVI